MIEINPSLSISTHQKSLAKRQSVNKVPISPGARQGRPRFMSTLTVSLLGAFQATLDGRPITGFESNKVRALLAYLAVEADRLHSRDELIGLLWPDQPDTALVPICAKP
jgi:hypothetical protein